MYKKNIYLLSLFNFLIGLTFFAPIAVIYFAKVSGSYMLGTAIFGVIMLSAALFEIPTGILSDRVGRKHTFILGSVARITGFIFYAIGQSFWFLVVGALFEGLSKAFYSGNSEAFLYDTLLDYGKENEYREHLGKTNAQEFNGLTIASVIGGFIANISFSYVMWLSVLTQIGLLIVNLLFTEPKSHKKEESNTYVHLREALVLFIKNKKLRLLSLAAILNNSFDELAYQFRGAFFQTIWPIWALGFANLISNLTAAAGFYCSGKITKKIKSEAVKLWQSITSQCISLISLVFPTPASPAIMSCTSFLYGVGYVAESDLRHKEYTNHQRATMSSFVSLGRSIGAAIMSVILGKTADIIGPRNALLCITLLAFSVTYMYWIIYRSSLQTTAPNSL